MKYVLSSEMLLLPGLERTCRRNIPIARDVNLRLSDVRLPAWSPPMGGSGCSGLTRGVRKMVSRAKYFLILKFTSIFHLQEQNSIYFIAIILIMLVVGT